MAKGLRKDAFLCTVMTFIIAGLLYFAFINLSILDPFEKAFKDFKFTDIFYAERFNAEQRNTKIVLVNIKHADRYQIAQAINKIAQQDPKAVGLDIIFKDQKLQYTDSILKQSIATYGNIVTAYFKEGDSIVKNNSYFEIKDSLSGFINLNLKGQNTVIRDFVGAKGKDKLQFSFATQLAITSGYIDKAYALEELSHPMPINYVGNKDMFLNFNIETILATEKIPVLKDAVVILGYLGEGNDAFDIEDKHFTPLNKSWVGRAVPDTYGVAIHANILNMLTQKSLILRVSAFIVYFVAFLLTFLVILFSMKLYKRNSFVFDISEKVIQLLLSVIVLYVAFLLLQSNIYINVMPLILFPILGIEMMDYYEHLITYLNKKFKWESQLL